MNQKRQEEEEEGNEETQRESESKQIVAISRPLIQTPGASAFSCYLNRDKLPKYFRHSILQQQKQQELKKKLENFWINQNHEIEESNNLGNHCLPLARIKKVMKSDEQVSMISAEVPVLFAKACEMFIMEMTMRSWAHAEMNQKKTIQKSDIASAISSTDVFDFLVDIVPREEDTMDNEIFRRRESVPYYYVPLPPHHAAPPGMFMGTPELLPNPNQENGDSSD